MYNDFDRLLHDGGDKDSSPAMRQMHQMVVELTRGRRSDTLLSARSTRLHRTQPEVRILTNPHIVFVDVHSLERTLHIWCPIWGRSST